MNAALCDFSICGALEKHLLTYLLTYLLQSSCHDCTVERIDDHELPILVCAEKTRKLV